MDDEEVQKSCWGVTTWAMIVFIGLFAVVSFFGNEHDKSGAVVSAERSNPN